MYRLIFTWNTVTSDEVTQEDGRNLKFSANKDPANTP